MTGEGADEFLVVMRFKEAGLPLLKASPIKLRRCCLCLYPIFPMLRQRPSDVIYGINLKILLRLIILTCAGEPPAARRFFSALRQELALSGGSKTLSSPQEYYRWIHSHHNI
jgi:hypothetical protein